MAQAQDIAREQQRSQQLLNAVAEHMKLPLLTVRNQAELSRMGGEVETDVLESATDAGLMLIEHYLQWQRTVFEHSELELEQSSLSSVLYDVAHQLDKIARSRNTQLQLDITGKYSPVMTHRRTLHAALASLGLSFIESAQDDAPVVLGVHKSRWGIVTGVYSRGASVSADMFKTARALSNVGARQTMPSTSHTQMSGFILADALLETLSAKLRTAKHAHMSGLATTLVPNPQLALL